MAENKKSFILYCDLIHQIEGLTDDEAGKLMKHLLRYVNDQNPCAEDRLTAILFEPIKQQLKRDLIKWGEKSAKRSEIGRLGGLRSGETRAKKKEANEAIASKRQANEPVNVNDNVSDNEIKKDIIYFIDFWDLYNKKVGSKTKCEKKWNSFSEKIKQKIMETLPFFLSTIKDKQFQPHPLTYLNNERWEDEITFYKIDKPNETVQGYNPIQASL